MMAPVTMSETTEKIPPINAALFCMLFNPIPVLADSSNAGLKPIPSLSIANLK